MPQDPRIAAIHEHLAATQERPVERAASRWLGEAEAVADDLVDADVSEDVIATRLGHVRDLLDHVEDTEDEIADDRVADSKRLVAEVLADVDGD